MISLYYQNYTSCIIYHNGVVIDPFSKQYGIHIVYTVRKIYNLYNSLTFKHSIKHAKKFFHIAHCLDKTDIIVYNDIKLFIQAFNSIIYKGSESNGRYQ